MMFGSELAPPQPKTLLLGAPENSPVGTYQMKTLVHYCTKEVGGAIAVVLLLLTTIIHCY